MTCVKLTFSAVEQKMQVFVEKTRPVHVMKDLYEVNKDAYQVTTQKMIMVKSLSKETTSLLDDSLSKSTHM